MAVEARRLVTDEEGEAQRSMRHFAWQLVWRGNVFDAVPGCQEPVRMKTNILLNTFLELPWHGATCTSLKLDMIVVQGQGDVQHDSKHLHCFRHRGARRLQHDKQFSEVRPRAKSDIHQLVRDLITGNSLESSRWSR